MLTFSILTEAVVPRKYIGAGLGGLGGAFLGGIIGQQVGNGLASSPIIGAGLGSAAGLLSGRYAGAKMIDDPEAPADFNKASHCVGYLANPHSDASFAAMHAVGLSAPAAIGANIYNGVSNMGAKRLGYKTPGRVATAILGPLTGLVSPDEVAKNK